MIWYTIFNKNDIKVFFFWSVHSAVDFIPISKKIEVILKLQITQVLLKWVKNTQKIQLTVFNIM